jgi:phosphatidate cytidylyltransferase
MVRLRGIRVHRTGLLVMTVLMLPAAMPDGHPLALFARVGLPGREALLIGFLMGMLALALARSQRDALVTAVYTLLGYLWIPGFLSYGLTLRASPDPAAGLATLTLPVLAVIASDVGGWGFGTTLGRRKLAPVLSPDKTVEGAIGGLALAAAVLPVAARLLPGAGPATMPVGLLILFAVLVAAASQLGDLFESLVKRWAGVKDTGVFLPGQGGVLDRIDSALFALPVAYLLLSLLGYV